MSQTNLKYKDVYFDSDEEVFVAMWAEEMKQAGFVETWWKPTKAMSLTEGLKINYTKKTVLKTKIKTEQKEKIILRPSEYTPDFKIEFSIKGERRFLTEVKYHVSTVELNPESIFYTAHPISDFAILEVKPSFDQNNMERLFVNNQKFIWDKHQIFVNLVEPIELFKKTFLPLAAAPHFRYKKVPKKAHAKGKKVGDFKFDWIPKTINEFLNI